MINVNQVPGDQYLPLMEHIKELRSRLFVVVAVLVVTVILAFPISGDLVRFVWNSLIPPNADLVVYSPMEWIISRLWISLVISAMFTVPVFVVELFWFMQKGLYPNEKRFFLIIVPTSLFLFLAGGAVAYYILIPLIFNYMLFYSADAAASGLSIKQTFSMISTLIIVFGMLFQFPLLVIFSIKSGLVTREQLTGKRMLVYGALIGFALFVAPDITGMSQLIMAFFLVILFELSLLISRLL